MLFTKFKIKDEDLPSYIKDIIEGTGLRNSKSIKHVSNVSDLVMYEYRLGVSLRNIKFLIFFIEGHDYVTVYPNDGTDNTEMDFYLDDMDSAIKFINEYLGK